MGKHALQHLVVVDETMLQRGAHVHHQKREHRPREQVVHHDQRFLQRRIGLISTGRGNNPR